MINVVIGTMKSSKTAVLINFFDTFQEVGMDSVVFYPSCCEKKEDYVVSRDNNKQAKAVKVFDISDMYHYVKNKRVVFIDEFQFITNSEHLDEFMNFLEYCDKNDKIVYLHGLNLDYTGTAFDIVQRVIPYADNVIIKHAKCECCGEDANRCVRYIDGILDDGLDSDILLMEDENIVYKSVCKKCYRKITNKPVIK